jgi:hypothetical protein
LNLILTEVFDSWNKKGASPHLIALEAVESPATNKREPTPEREPFTYHPVAFKISTFLKQESKRIASNYVEESQIYLKTASYRAAVLIRLRI